MYSVLNSTVNRNELRTYLNTYDQNNARTAMTSTAFNSLYQTINNHSSSSAKYNSINTAFTTSGNNFTVAQAKKMILLINDENARLALSKVAYSTLVDRTNYMQLNELFNYQTTRNNFNSYVQNFDSTTPGSTVVVPMADAEFNTLYRNVNNAWTSTSRYNLVLTAFQSATNYFTVSQVRQLLLLVTGENDKLALAKTVYNNLTDPFNYTQVNEVFSNTATRTEWARYVTDVQNGGTGTGVGTNTPMSENDFNTLYRNVNGSWSNSGRYSLVASAFQNTANYFTIAQVRQLLTQISVESEKLTLAKASFRNLTDPFNYTQLNDVFNTTESRTEWARYVTDIQNGGTGVGIKTAMPDSEYRSLYRSVQLTFGFGAKMSSLMDIFNKETNYFTTGQIKELVSLVSSETNRVELAKLAYDNAVDPQNYSVVASVLSSQSSKDELNVYIGTVK